MIKNLKKQQKISKKFNKSYCSLKIRLTNYKNNIGHKFKRIGQR